MNHSVMQISSGLPSPSPQAVAVTLGGFRQSATEAHTAVCPVNSISTATVDIGMRTTGMPQAPDPVINSRPWAPSTDGKIVASIEQSRHPPPLLSVGQAQSIQLEALATTKQPLPDKPHHASIDLSGATISVTPLGPPTIAMDSDVFPINSQPTPCAPRMTPEVRSVLYPTGRSSVSGPHADSVPGPTSNPLPRGRRLGMGARGFRPYEPPEKRARTKA